MRSVHARTCTGLLAAFLCVSGALVSAAAPTRKQRIRELRQRLHQLAQKKAIKEAQLRQTKRAQFRLSDMLNESQQRLEEAKSELSVSQDRLRKAEIEVREATARLQKAEADLALQRTRFGRRLAVSYMEGPVTLGDVLLGAGSIADFLDRQYYVSCVVSHDAELLTALREAQQRVARERERLLERKEELAVAHLENEARVTQVAYEAQEQGKLLQRIRQERALQEQRLAELEEDSLDIQHSLEGEFARRQANPGAYRNLPRWSGSLTMPARGPVTSGFGYRYHPILKYQRLHSGVDIGAASGAAVYAAADGEVFFASWRGGYGQCIIVLHGEGMSTLYAHLSQIHVSPGERVRRGQHIGAVGSTGLSTGPHLHFEVRRHGVPVNPL